MMKKGVNNAANILKALMTYSYHGQSEMHETDVHEIIDNTLVFIRATIPHYTELIKDYRFTSRIMAYPEKLHQVFINILSNAIFEITRLKEQVNPVIKISTSKLKREKKNYVSIEFFNTGKQISEEDISHIFDPFYTTKKPGEGTGLGLSISFSLIQEHGGTIRAENRIDGVAFIIELPGI